jgi:protein gp37
MAETTIEWTDFTVNFWWGCTKVGPGCDHCYAETWDKRTGGAHWGPHAERRWIKGAAAALRKIHTKAETYRLTHGRWPRVFMQSMSDLFDNAVDARWRKDALFCAAIASDTRIQMLTKRIGNVEDMVGKVWLKWPSHIGLMITVCNQAEADRDIPKLLDLKARLEIPWVGLSLEPMLGQINLLVTDQRGHDIWALDGTACDPTDPEGADEYYPCEKLDWVICGGESGPGARPMHPDWARSLRDQCVAAGVQFLFKQWGEYGIAERLLPSQEHDVTFWPDGSLGNGNANNNGGPGWSMRKLGKKAAGRLLDGRTWDEVPHV